MLVLRPHQEASIERIREYIRAGKRRILLVLATGAGKTYTAGRIIHNVVNGGKRAIFLAHRRELIKQSSETLDNLQVDHGVIKRNHPRRNRDKSVQVASIQTLIRREHWPADLVVIDEAHRSVANSYVKIVERYDDPIIIGLTATPYRRDGRPLGRKYDKDGNEVGFGYDAIVEVISVQELIDQGYLVEPTIYGCANPDMSKVKIGSSGDYDGKSASKAMQKTIMHGELLTNWTKICGRATGAETTWGTVPIDADGNEIQGELFINDARPTNTRSKVLYTNCNACTVAFLPSVEDSIRMVQQFKDAGVKAEHIDGDTPERIRGQALEALANREIYVIGNCELLIEGWDLPHLECIIAARPTRSPSLFRQMGGRVMRPDDDKRFAYILDHANWTRTHGFLTQEHPHSLDAREKRPRKGSGEAPYKECPECDSLLPLMARVCPECGHEFPARETVYTDEDLVELNGKTIVSKSSIPIEVRQTKFNQLAAECERCGYKPNYVGHRYMKEFDEWPTSETGIQVPQFFWRYKRRFEKRQKQQAAQKTVAQAS